LAAAAAAATKWLLDFSTESWIYYLTVYVVLSIDTCTYGIMTPAVWIVEASEGTEKQYQ